MFYVLQYYRTCTKHELICIEAFGSLIIGVLGYDFGTCQSRWLIFQLTFVLRELYYI